MNLDITDLEGDQYFFNRNRESEKSLENAFLLAGRLKAGKLEEKKEERIRKGLAGSMGNAMGFRKAEKLALSGPDEICGELGEEQRNVREYARLNTELFRAAAESAGRLFPSPAKAEEYTRKEMKRDSVYHTLQRTGLAGISSARRSSCTAAWA